MNWTEVGFKEHEKSSPVQQTAQHPVVFDVCLGTKKKGPLALKVERLQGWWISMLAAIADVVGATLAALGAFFDAMLVATLAGSFWDGNQGLALAPMGLGPVAVVPCKTCGLCRGPDCLQPYLEKVAAMMDATSPAATLAAWMCSTGNFC